MPRPRATLPSREGTTSHSSGSPVYAVPAQGGVTKVDDRPRTTAASRPTGRRGLRLINFVGVEDYLRGMAEAQHLAAAAVQA